jgi:uncharacterized zinc-type alcohol dehydrogenase-like protein
MIKTKGYAAQSAGTTLSPWTFERKEPGSRDVLLKITHCGVCHTDLHLIRNDWFPGIFPMVPGHEIVGTVVQVGDEVKKFKVGERGGVGVMIDSCMECPDCLNHQEQFCRVSPVQTYNSRDKQGNPVYGGYSDMIVVREEFVHRIAENLSPAGVAPLLCAGITTYSPLRNWKVGKGHKLAVVGLGGLGHMAVKFGVAFGADVTVLSTSPAKEKAALELGAQHFSVTTNEAVLKELDYTFDFILDTVAADHDINPYVSLLKANGVYINVGMPAKPWSISSFSLAMGNKVIAGSGAGGLAQTQEMLDFCADNNIVSDVEIIGIRDIGAAFDRLEKGDVRYRFVIDMESLNQV